MKAELIVRAGSQEMTLAAFDVPVVVVATGEVPVADVILNTTEFYRLLAAALREAAAEVEKLPNVDPHAPEDPA